MADMAKKTWFITASLNIIWGIAAVSSSHFFVANAHYILGGLNTWGWIAIVFGAVELLAAASIWSGGAFGRSFGVLVARHTRPHRPSKLRKTTIDGGLVARRSS